MKNFKKFVCFDTETESLNLRLSRPWQVSWIVFNHVNDFYDVQDRYLDWPDLNLSEGARKITGFNVDLYEKRKESPQVVLNDFKKLLSDENICYVFHNGLGFDIYQVANWKRCCGEKEDWSYLERCVDTHAVAKAQKLDIPVDKANFLAWQFKLVNERAKVKTSIKTLCKEFGINFDEEKLHNSIYDVERNIDIFQKLKYNIW